MIAGAGPGGALRSVLIGSESLLVECAGILANHGHSIVAVVAGPGPAADWAVKADVPLFRHARDLLSAGLGAIDYLFSITNLAILPPEVLALPSRAAINFHDGPLPAYAGLNTPVWALLAGEAQHGVTWHLMTDQVDHGDILASESFPIDADETALSLNTKCFAAGIQSFAFLTQLLKDGAIAGKAQPCAPLRQFGRTDRPADAAAIDWAAPADAILRLIRALDFGAYRNPMGAPKARLGGTLLLVQGAEIEPVCSGAAPGTIVQGGATPVVATGTTDLRLILLSAIDGERIDQLPVREGDRFDPIGADERRELSTFDAAAARHEAWWHARLAARDCLRLPHFAAGGESDHRTLDMVLPGTRAAKATLAAAIAYLARVADKATFDMGFSDAIFAASSEPVRGWFAPQLPLRVQIDWASDLTALQDKLAEDIGEMRRRIGFAADLIARSPALRGGTPAAHPITVQLVDRLDQANMQPGNDLLIAIGNDGRGCRWLYDAAALSNADVRDLQQGLLALLASADQAPLRPIGELDLLLPEERTRVVQDRNAAAAPLSSASGIHRLFIEQAARTPDRAAVTSRGVSLTYAELDARSNRLARHLDQNGVVPGVLVGLNLERSADMLVALLAIHKAGGAYVPLDPAYPADRVAYMIEDSAVAVIVTQQSIADRLPENGAMIVCIDADRRAIDTQSAEPFDGGSTADDLAYVIYTSGSTGHPKGVMVEHRNVLNFFIGMDAKLEAEQTWLAVTSLSFDISVLELCWTVARGCHVVIATGEEVRGVALPPQASRPIDFSLFYFASADSGSAADSYRLLFEGAKFADEHGFEAVWTPERHFHAFGGLYPNPSVTAAAIAATTSRVKIRGGSVVAPLHHPVRIAEEWSLVDNFSNGRVGIAFASGWQPNDFVLRPENFADKNGALLRTIDDVRALWRGEKRSFPGPLGKDVEVGTFPRPIQPELPFWITSAGNPDTFAAAGKAGAFVLTHLLGQTVAEVAEKLRIYRDAWRAAGHPGEGHVTLMLHTLVGNDADAVRAIVRKPLIEYLRTSTNLVKQYAWSFPAFKRPAGSEGEQGQVDLESLSNEETEALLEHAFDRYFEASGLFGTPEDCLPLIGELRGAGVDEIACLIDFGVPAAQVIDHLPMLNTLRVSITQPREAVAETLPDLLARHRVTHLQCTPSLAQMLVEDEQARPALAQLRCMMVGGEAFPPALARDLGALVGGSVMNMYGPTETTIWSAVHALDGSGDAVPLGQPLANQQIYVLDSRRQLVRPGTPGEIVIGGKGVVRGYLHRPELTAERFIADPFRDGARAYRTGDLARHRPDGTLDFLGRMDNQVKIRGYRIELGEIEAVLARHPQIEQAVVADRREQSGEVRLVAYVVPRGAMPDAADLRAHLSAALPDFMVPAVFARIEAIPLTPNGKTDRNALPSPDAVLIQMSAGAFVVPAEGLQERIAAVWRDVLKLPRVGIRDNFFDLGGHSLLAVQAHRRLSAIADRPIALTDVFRFPTIEALSAHLSRTTVSEAGAQQGQERAQNRRAALQRRQSVRALLRN